jgi:dTDP-4-dehydrorhamnose 3,5-epimerase
MRRKRATRNVGGEVKVRELKVPGAWEITPTIHGDSRGLFFEWLTDHGFTAFAGHRLDVRQANCSVSSAGVLRGLHFAQLPPGQAKYVTCVSGSVFDVVVDIRVGSPTFGQWDSVLLDVEDRRTMYISEGLGHAFLALQDNSTIMYLCSTEYNPQREHTICATDPAFAIDWPLVDGAPPSLSDRDAAAPSLEEALASGLLPAWADTQRLIAGLRDEA